MEIHLLMVRIIETTSVLRENLDYCRTIVFLDERSIGIRPSLEGTLTQECLESSQKPVSRLGAADSLLQYPLGRTFFLF